MKNLVTASEVVASLPGITADWLSAEARAGRAPSVKLGRRRLYDPADIEAWLETRKQGTDAWARSGRGRSRDKRSA